MPTSRKEGTPPKATPWEEALDHLEERIYSAWQQVSIGLGSDEDCSALQQLQHQGAQLWSDCFRQLRQGAIPAALLLAQQANRTLDTLEQSGHPSSRRRLP